MIPIWFIVTILISFIWLFYESDWMRIRLLVGKIVVEQPEPIKTIHLWKFSYGSQVGFTSNVGYSIHGNPTYLICGRTNDATLLSPGLTEPICSWDWLLSHEHPIAEYKITILAWNVRHHITLDGNNGNANLMKDICKFALKPNKEERKYINRQRKELKLARIGGKQ